MMNDEDFGEFNYIHSQCVDDETQTVPFNSNLFHLIKS